jgi:hypothetical protein
MLDPSGLGKMLGKLLLDLIELLQPRVVQDGTGAGGALVEGDDVVRHGKPEWGKEGRGPGAGGKRRAAFQIAV